MANLNIADFDKLKAFLKALQDINFDPTKQIPGLVKIGGRPTPVDKTRCLELLHSFPDFAGKEDRDIIKHLAKPGNIERIFGDKITRAQQIELAQALKKELTTAETSEQETSAEQTTATGSQPNPTPGGTGGMPTTPSITFAPRVPRMIHNVPHTPKATQPVVHIVNKSRAISETPLGSKLVIANSSGAIKEAPPKQIYIADKGGTIKEHTINSPSRFNFPAFRSSVSAAFKKAQNFASPAGIFFQRNAGKYLTGERTLGLLGKMGNSGLGMFSNMSNFGNRPGGAFFSIGNLGRARPRSFFGRIGGRSGPEGVSAVSNIGKNKGKWALLGLLTFMGLVGILGFMGANPTEPIPGGGIPYGTSDISQCKFTWAGTSAQFQSQLLLSFVQEAANKSSIPPVVLAAFIRVESPASSTMSDSQISNYTANCARSVTGALGIMQIQPPGTTSLNGDPASCDDCIDAGARLIGKTVSTLTTADYCDPRTNIIVGAGWILKKMSKLGYGDGTKWDPAWTNNRQAIEALVNTYYGCLLYGGQNDCTGPFNYATDVQTSIANCQPQSGGLPPGATTDCPIPGGSNRITCGSQFTPLADYRNGNLCGHCGVGYPPSSTAAFCGWPGTKYGLDVAGEDLQPILLPKIGNNIVNWTFRREEGGSKEAIQQYIGVVSNSSPAQAYYLQFHHTQPGSGNPNARQSGDIGGKICGNGCGEKHTHIQVGNGGDNPGGTAWLDAAQYFCKQ